MPIIPTKTLSLLWNLMFNNITYYVHLLVPEVQKNSGTYKTATARSLWDRLKIKSGSGLSSWTPYRFTSQLEFLRTNHRPYRVNHRISIFMFQSLQMGHAYGHVECAFKFKWMKKIWKQAVSLCILFRFQSTTFSLWYISLLASPNLDS